jgi:hypothetical protein
MVNHFFVTLCEKGVKILPWGSLEDGALGNGVCLKDEEGASVTNAEPLGDTQVSAVAARVDRPRLPIGEEKFRQHVDTGFDEGVWFD